MTGATRQTQGALKQAKHRAGVKSELKAIRAAVEDLQADVRQALAAALIRQSISNSETNRVD
jgi:hypothetical protein